MAYGMIQKQSKEGSRWEIECPHQNGVLYVVPAEASWVCSQEHLSAHALAGFLRELVHLNLPQVRELMQRWGLYFRERPISTEAAQKSTSQQPE